MPGYSDIEQKEMDTREKLDANRTADRTCPDVDGTASNDTREKLEADVLRLFGYRDEATIIKEWLDRQAAITEREVFGENKLSVNCDACLFKKRVDALTAERGYWYTETRNIFDAVERWHPFGLNPSTMDYPPREGVTNPATLVIAYMDGLRNQCAERVAPPLASDGEPLHINDAVYGEDGIRWIVTGFQWGSGHCVQGVDKKGRTRDLKTSWLTHEAPRTVEDVLADLQHDTLTTQGEYAGEVIDADEFSRELGVLVEHAVDELRGMMGGAE